MKVSPKFKPPTSKRSNGPLVRKAALSYANDLQWKVIPIFGIRDGVCSCPKGALCDRAGKHPAINDWPAAASTDPNVIRNWFRPGLCRNVGIVTGSTSGVMVFDIDKKHGGLASYYALREKARLPKTPRSTTGAGHHVFFLPDPRVPTSQGTLFGSGIDIRAEKGLVVMPPSLHVSGKKYAWIDGRAAGVVPLAPFPSEWLPNPTQSVEAVPEASPGNENRVHLEGTRNAALTSLAGSLVNTSIGPEALLAALQKHNLTACRPPLPVEEVQRIADSIGRYPVHPSGDEAEVFSKLVMDRRFHGGDHLLLGPDGRLWSYGQTHWSPMRDEAISKIVLDCSNEVGIRPRMSKTALLHQVKTLLRAKASAEGDPLKFREEPAQIINCRNTELWLRADGSVEPKPHNAKSYLRHTMQVDYDPSAKCPMYEKAIHEIFGASDDPEGLVSFWHELCGYALQPSRPSAIIVIGKGNGSNGKTKLTGTLIKMLGYDLVVATPVQELDKNRFSAGNLVGKYLLIDDDVKSGTRLPDGALKKLSEDKPMTGEHKFGEHFTFVARVIPMMLCNNFPSVADLSPGLQRRLKVVPFERSFLNRAEDTRLFERIWANEMPGILNLYLAGLGRVVSRNWRLQEPQVMVQATKKFLQGANPLPEFVASMCTEGVSKHCRLEYIYSAFGGWAKDNGITYAQQQSSFKKNLENLGFKFGKRKDGIHCLGLTLNSRDV